MAAEWELRVYRVDLARLTAVVGSNDASLGQLIVRAVNDEDPRLGDLTVEDVVDELITGALEREHARAYRIALEAFADVTALRLEVTNPRDRVSDQVTTADRVELGGILETIGMSALGTGWDTSKIAWPWKAKPPRIDWPSASYWTAAELKACADELSAVQRKGSPSSLACAATTDEFFADDNATVVGVLAQLVVKARAKLPAKLPRCVGGTNDGLLILLDGEQ